jgi:hypothetical protein
MSCGLRSGHPEFGRQGFELLLAPRQQRYPQTAAREFARQSRTDPGGSPGDEHYGLELVRIHG